jgi:hypothetical protein
MDSYEVAVTPQIYRSSEFETYLVSPFPFQIFFHLENTWEILSKFVDPLTFTRTVLSANCGEKKRILQINFTVNCLLKYCTRRR